ncbi:TonB-dependent receptor [Rubricoccus marinus]|uniref:TonB-dependent receptor n=1 Tax=Rubricoccus marinus TaxID=716817 RepID=A0A259TVY1_9BACT|nr:TonB-dependent receptor [Rubricoccus marinus]OZC01856.1 hypothetical protein BSZ36_01940 [Rubricoccus marinus]
MRLFVTSCLLAVALFGASGASAQATGILNGTVVDAESGETLIGANIYVPSIERGAATDLDGNYRITGLPAGSYDVQYSFAGLVDQTVTGVEIVAGQTTTINVQLTSDELETVTVTAAAIIETNSEVGLLRLRARAAQVSDAISAEAISQSGSSDASDAMERVTGASVQGGKYVFVRGLGDRYANTQLNGATLPTADPDRRAVQFDLFPSEFLENIITLKTFTPDKPGSFSGGLVDINTRSFPEQMTASLSVSTGASTLVTPGGDILVDPATSVSYVGTASDFEIPSELLGEADLPVLSRQIRFNPEADPEMLAAVQLNERLVDAFGARSVAPEAGTAAPNVSASGAFGNRFSVLGNDLGFIVSGTFDRGVSSYDEGIVGRYGTAGENESGQQLPQLRQRRNDQRTTLASNLGGIANAAYRIGQFNEVSLNTLFSRNAESEARLISGPAPFPIGGTGDPITVTDRVVGHAERQLASASLRGRHELPRAAGVGVEWRASYAETQLDEPDLRFFANANLSGASGGNDLVVGGASLNNTLHFFRESTETLGGLGLDLTVPERALGGLATIKVGGLYETTARDFRERRFEILSEGLQLNGEDAESVNAFFSEANSGVLEVLPANPRDPQQRQTYLLGNIFRDGTQDNNQYDGGLDVAAGYAMAEFSLIDRLRVIAGARYERTDLSIDVVNRITGDAVAPEDPDFSNQIAENDILPSLNVVYALTDNMNVRTAATRTLARPTFREIAPFCAFDFGTDGELCGNPELNRTLISNLDLRWEWFNTPGSLLAASVYYKDLQSPIERVIIDNDNGLQEFQNVSDATILGAEFEARQRLETFGLTGPVLRNLSLGGNLTVTRSEITIGETELAERRTVNPDAADTRPLQGQSPFLVNVDLSYDNPTSDTRAGLFFNVFGRRLSRVGIPDVYENPSPQLDFVASQRLLDQISVKLSVKNILNANAEEVYDFPESTYSAIGGLTPFYLQRERGTSFSLGISFSPAFGGGSPAVPPAPSASGVGRL